MTAKIVFLGKLADLAGSDERDVAAPLDWPALLETFGPELAEAAQADTTKLAVNGKLLADKTTLAISDGDEIALLPPVSGG